MGESVCRRLDGVSDGREGARGARDGHHALAGQRGRHPGAPAARRPPCPEHAGPAARSSVAQLPPLRPPRARGRIAAAIPPLRQRLEPGCRHRDAEAPCVGLAAQPGSTPLPACACEQARVRVSSGSRFPRQRHQPDCRHRDTEAPCVGPAAQPDSAPLPTSVRGQDYVRVPSGSRSPRQRHQPGCRHRDAGAPCAGPAAQPPAAGMHPRAGSRSHYLRQPFPASAAPTRLSPPGRAKTHASAQSRPCCTSPRTCDRQAGSGPAAARPVR